MVSITGKVNHQIVIEASIVIEHIKVTERQSTLRSLNAEYCLRAAK